MYINILNVTEMLLLLLQCASAISSPSGLVLYRGDSSKHFANVRAILTVLLHQSVRFLAFCGRYHLRFLFEHNVLQQPVLILVATNGIGRMRGSLTDLGLGSTPNEGRL